jgi:hypothetical protein
VLSIAANWGRHCGKHIDKIGLEDLAEFCVGHQLELELPADYFPPDHHTFPFDGPRKVRVYDTYVERGQPRQMAVYLLDLPLVDKPDDHEFATCTFPVKSPKHTAASKDWSFMRALKHSFPGVTYLKDLLPGADASVVFQNTLLPIHTVVASRLTGGGKRELLVQFSESNYENSAWVREKFVPRPYLDDFLQRVDPDEPPVPAHN